MPEPISFFEFFLEPQILILCGFSFVGFFLLYIFLKLIIFELLGARNEGAEKENGGFYFRLDRCLGVSLLGVVAFAFSVWAINPAGARGYGPTDYCEGEKASETLVHVNKGKRGRVFIRRPASDVKDALGEQRRLSWLVAEMTEQDRWGGVGAADCRYFSYDEEEKADAVLYFDNGSLAEGYAQIMR